MRKGRGERRCRSDGFQRDLDTSGLLAQTGGAAHGSASIRTSQRKPGYTRSDPSRRIFVDSGCVQTAISCRQVLGEKEPGEGNATVVSRMDLRRGVGSRKAMKWTEPESDFVQSERGTAGDVTRVPSRGSGVPRGALAFFSLLMCLVFLTGSARGETIRRSLMQYGYGVLQDVAVSPDGTKMLSAESSSAVLRDLGTGNIVQIFTGHSGDVTSVAFSPDGTQVITGSWDRSARIWDVATGAEIHALLGHSFEVTSVAFSPDGTLAAIAHAFGIPRLRWWDSATGAEIGTPIEGGGIIESIAFSPDGTGLYVAAGDEVTLYDLTSGSEVRTFSGHDHHVLAVAPSLDGTKIVTGSVDATAKLWDVSTGADIQTFTGYTFPVASVAFSPDGTQVLAGGDVREKSAKLRLWDAATGSEVHSFSGHTSTVHSVSFTPDGTQILSSSHYKGILWDAGTRTSIRTFSCHSGPGSGTPVFVEFSQDGTRVLTGAYDETAKLWDTETGAEIGTITGNTDGVSSMAFSPDGSKILTGLRARTAKLWATDTLSEIHTFTGYGLFVKDAVFSSDGTQVFTTDGIYSKVWDVVTGSAIHTASIDLPGGIYSAAISPDKTQILTGLQYKLAVLWDAATGEEIRRFSGNNSAAIYCVAFSPDGMRALTGSNDRSVRVWDVVTGEQIHVLGHPATVRAAAFSPDGTKVLSGGDDGMVKLWDAASGTELRAFAGHTADVSSVAFSPDGGRILTGSYDQTGKLWPAGGWCEGEAEGEGVSAAYITGGGWCELGTPLALRVHHPCAVGMTTYEWYKDGGILSVSGADLTISQLAYEDAGLYTCLITDDSRKGMRIAGPIRVQVVDSIPVSGFLGVLLATVLLVGLGSLRVYRWS